MAMVKGNVSQTADGTVDGNGYSDRICFGRLQESLLHFIRPRVSYRIQRQTVLPYYYQLPAIVQYLTGVIVMAIVWIVCGNVYI